ncbi:MULTISPECIES: M23 family metallopeptidase [Aeromicrobium]|uniref:M23 family metallopeptidase n=1 Tax=Aeromicrobium TaxID=2040 RepID=UPI001ABB8A05|nr:MULTISPECIES: M23 family metallopeptidase [Aeromicrobium]
MAGKRAAERRRTRKRFTPTPAMAGAFALVLAAFGSAIVSDNTDANSLRADKYQTISQSYTGPDEAAGGDVDISRDFNRTTQLRQTKAQAGQTQRAQQELVKAVGKEATKQRLNQWVIPVTGYHLTARFGQRSGLWSTTHTGLDFAGPAGTTIVSIAAGTVKSTGYEGAYGNRTVITLNDGTEVWYCHQSKIAVSPGDQVGPGDVIGYTGSTGNVTGPHLHLEVRPGGGGPIDPYAALVEHKVTP